MIFLSLIKGNHKIFNICLLQFQAYILNKNHELEKRLLKFGQKLLFFDETGF